MNEEKRKLAMAAHRAGDERQAEKLYRVLLDIDPIVDDAINLGGLLRRQGRLEEAAAIYEIWLKKFRDNRQLHLNASNCLHDLKENKTCIELLKGYLKRHPGDEAIERKLARSLMEEQNLREANTLLLRLTQENPSEPENWMELGLCYYKQEKIKEALNSFEKVSDIKPENSLAWANQISILSETGRFGECHELIDKLEQNHKQKAEVRSAIAKLYIQENDLKAAEKELATLCRDEPNNGGHWLNLAANLRKSKQANAALTVIKRGLCCSPRSTDLLQALGQALAELGKPEIAVSVLRQSAGPLDQVNEQHLFNVQFNGAAYHLIPPEELKASATSWEKRLLNKRGLRQIWADTVREPLQNRRLRVGYFSADWCNHPVCRFMLPVLRHHDRKTVEIWGLSSSPHHDREYAMAKTECEHWLDVRHANDMEIARIISDLNLDVLVELGGYTGNSRIQALVHKPAPVQLSYLGYFAPTYLKAIDGWIGDEELFGGLEPTDATCHTLWKAKDGYMAYEGNRTLPECERADGTKFRFGSFNHSRKLNPETIRLYADVLKDVPYSQLVLKSFNFVEEAEQLRVMRCLRKAGIATERIKLLDATNNHEEHLKLYKELDAVLDPCPYGGATSTCDALIMGVPVVSLASTGMVGRLSSSILTSARLEGWIARSKEEYRKIAQDLAAAGPRHAQARQQLRTHVQSSPLCDAPRLCRELERIYAESYSKQTII